ncbi:MAG: hypothetical protein ACFFCT_06045 [Candidatus Odinarchaeota archaeon]
MKKRTVCIATVIALTMLTGFANIPPATATVASDILLVYDYATQALTVNMSHYVANTKTHYIEAIEIRKNGISILNRSYANQSYNWGMYDTFNVPAAVDDNLTVTGICNKGYSLTRWLIVTSAIATNTPPSSTTSTTEPTNGVDVPGTSLGTGPAIAAGAVVIIFFVLFFAWLKPEYVPDVFKQLGARIRNGVTWLGEKLRDMLSWLKAGLSSLVQQGAAKFASK